LTLKNVKTKIIFKSLLHFFNQKCQKKYVLKKRVMIGLSIQKQNCIPEKLSHLYGAPGC